MPHDLVPLEGGLQSDDQSLYDDVQQRLEQRPRVTLRLRITLVFAIFTLATAAITAASMLSLSRFRTRMQFLEAVDDCAFEIQEARRYEKNYLLYGTSLYEALDHIYKAHRLLETHAERVKSVAGAELTRRWMVRLEQYQELLEELAGNTTGASREERDGARRGAETRLRRLGAEILADSSDLIARERQEMNQAVRTASVGAVAFLGIMVMLMGILGDQLARQVIRPIGRFTRYVERIADGDFSPIRPARRYKDEFSTLAVAINRMLDELKARQEQLLQSRKMAAVGTLTSGIAHELNNPLNNISLTVETLLDDFEDMDDEQKRQLLQDIFTQVQRSSATVRNLLDFTRKDQPVFTAIAIPQLLEATLKLVGNELALAEVKPQLDVEPNLPHLKANPRNLEQVFLNLFLNAMEAMPEGGVLSVSATREKDYVRVAVRDTGMGIPREQLDKIFEPFFTTKEAGEGTGLGLSVSYSIIEKHGGRLEVESHVGTGTTFFVLLPVQGERA